jgi:hypothetical protein
VADDPELPEPIEPKGPVPKGKPPELPTPGFEGTVVDEGLPPELERQATRPTPNPAAIATTITRATRVIVQALRFPGGVVVGGTGDAIQYGPEG